MTAIKLRKLTVFLSIVAFGTEFSRSWTSLLETAASGNSCKFKEAVAHCSTPQAHTLSHHVYGRHLIDSRCVKSAIPSLSLQNHMSYESVMEPVLSWVPHTYQNA